MWCPTAVESQYLKVVGHSLLDQGRVVGRYVQELCSLSATTQTMASVSTRAAADAKILMFAVQISGCRDMLVPEISKISSEIPLTGPPAFNSRCGSVQPAQAFAGYVPVWQGNRACYCAEQDICRGYNRPKMHRLQYGKRNQPPK